MLNRRVVIARTEGEWEEIDRIIKELGKSDINSYLRCEIYKLERKFEECPHCITPASGKKIIKQHRIKEADYEKLLAISEKMNRPINSIIEDLFIVPLLIRPL